MRIVFNLLIILVLALPPRPASAQAQAWNEYANTAAAFRFEYPAGAFVSSGQNLDDLYPTVNAEFQIEGSASYQGMVVFTLPNPSDGPAEAAVMARFPAKESPAFEPVILGKNEFLKAVIPATNTEYALALKGQGVVYLLAPVHGEGASAMMPEALRLFEVVAATFAPLPSAPQPVDLTTVQPEAPAGAPAALQAASLTYFTPPLGAHTGRQYAPRMTYDNNGKLIEDTRYGIKNPDLTYRWTCFGQLWTDIWHAGVDLYRADGTSTYGDEVSSLGSGTVYALDIRNYPGYAAVVQYQMPNGQPIYAVYMHIENLAVSVGQKVVPGQKIGTILHQYYTGQYPEYHPANDDSHLHFEMRGFASANGIYPYAGCNLNDTSGRGYTWPQYPDDFPTHATGYRDPLPLLALAPAVTSKVFLPYAASNPGCGFNNRLVNPGFESGKTGWTEQGVDIIITKSYPNLPVLPRMGNGLAWFGGRNDAFDIIYQDFSVPALNPPTLVVSYWVYVTTDEPNSNLDYLKVYLRTTGGLAIGDRLDRVDSLFTPKDQWVQRSVTLPSLVNQAGQTLRLSFEAYTNGTNKSSWFVDDIMLTDVCQ